MVYRQGRIDQFVDKRYVYSDLFIGPTVLVSGEVRIVWSIINSVGTENLTVTSTNGTVDYDITINITSTTPSIFSVNITRIQSPFLTQQLSMA